MFDDVAANAVEPDARALGSDLSKKAAADQMNFLGKVDPKDLQSLKAVLKAPADERLHSLLDRIGSDYVPFVAVWRALTWRISNAKI